MGLYRPSDNVFDIQPLVAANILKNKDGSWMVQNIWGPGWGPTLYKILIQITSENGKGISPYQKSGKVTKEAIGVWERFFSNDELIKTSPVPSPVHSEPCLNCIYSCQGEYYDLKEPISNHTKCISDIPKKAFIFFTSNREKNNSRNITSRNLDTIRDILRETARKSVDEYINN
ncbi:MAG: hypothetical protein CL578_06095 [Alteromonadaceae bacterium]|uniref:hypothetical protein n=1 Tax=uncultured Paraglaciecola sp. TaxID=1765024 RepID=UPI000C596DBF|nr:hypothetical protein [Alteromonadaceae bacterium]